MASLLPEAGKNLTLTKDDNKVSDSANFVHSANHLGIRGDFEKAGGPRSLVAYRAGKLYFHGGISLQECIVPVISIRLSKAQPQQEKATLKISYKNKAKYITIPCHRCGM